MSSNHTFSIGIAIVFFALLGAMAAATNLPDYVFFYYLLASAITYAMYYADKVAAQHDARRISENKLHVLAALGGWPGALIAQQTLRHKSAKVSFRKVFWATVVVNCALLLWLFTDSGAAFLHKAVGTSP